MKTLSIILMITACLMSGCGKKQEPVTEAKQDPASEKQVVEATAKQTEGKETVIPPVEPIQESVAKVGEKAKSAVSSLEADERMKTMDKMTDWAKFSWAEVSSVPFTQKDQLVTWALEQVSVWRNKMTSTALDTGANMMNNLGSTGWQGALKKVVDGIGAVKQSSPETYELARGALVSAWDNFEGEAGKVLGK